jgi:putative ATP-binding cassette transporter
MITLITGIVSGVSTTLLLMAINKSLGELNTTSPHIQALALSFIGLCAITLISKIVTETLLLKMAQKATMELRLDLSKKIVSSPFETLESLGTSKMFANLVIDINTLTGVITSIPTVGVSAIILSSCLIYLGSLSWQMLLVTLCFIFFGLSIYITLSNKARVIIEDIRNKSDNLYNCLRGVTEGVKELKMHSLRREHFINTDLKTVAQQIKNLNIASGLYFIFARNIGMMLFFILIGVLIFIVPQLMYIEPDALRGYVLVILYLIGPLQVILSTYPSIMQAKVSLYKIANLGGTLGESGQYAPRFPPAQARIKQLTLKNIEVEYRDQAGSGFRLGPIDIDLHPGEIVFLTGGNGSGKSTLAKVLVGLYNSYSGNIIIDDTVVDNTRLDWYRQHFTVVFSDYYLFSSVKGLNNIHVDKDVDNISQFYLDKLELSEKVKVEDGEFTTIKLSTGQRKRLALLVAYLEDRPIYVFDEWAADQDPIFKELFYTVLLDELKAKGKTIFVISHDDQYYHIADRLLKMDYGKLREIKEFALQS